MVQPAPSPVDLYGDVLVVDGRPRYHVEQCRHVAGKVAHELDLVDALDAGFTPCGVCKPDDVLLAQCEAEAAASVAQQQRRAAAPAVPAQGQAPWVERAPLAQQAPAWAGQQEPAPPAPVKGSGLAITALVLAILALVLCWVPIINNLAAVLALIGLAFGIPAAVSARRGRRAGRGQATASVVLSVLALVGVFATQAMYVAAIDEVVEDMDDRAAGRGTDLGAVGEAARDSAALAVGQTATVGDYTVTVTAIDTEAGAEIAAANSFNDSPTNQYVLVDATVTYVGDGTGDPWIDLSAGVLGSDGRQYDDGATSAVTPRSGEDMVTLRDGGSSQVDFVMDVPAGALAGAEFFVGESFSFDADAAVWAIG